MIQGNWHDQMCGEHPETKLFQMPPSDTKQFIIYQRPRLGTDNSTMSVQCNLIVLLSIMVGSPLSSRSAAQLVEEGDLSAGECLDLGFHSQTLKCSSCHMLGQFNLEELMTDCLGCCKEKGKEGDHERYPYAEIEYCECNLHRFPQVSAFIKSSMKDQWGAKVGLRHVRGILPTIVLKSEDGETQRSLNIEKWDTDTITAFLNDWLEGF